MNVLPASTPIEKLRAFSTKLPGRLPIVLQQRPAHGLSFADLAGALAEPALEQLMAGVAGGQRTVAGSFLIYGLTFAAEVGLLDPLVLDRVVLRPQPETLGVELGQDGWPVAVWLSDAQIINSPPDETPEDAQASTSPASLLGQHLRALFTPIENNLNARTGLLRRHLHHYVVDALAGQLLELERHAASGKMSLLPAFLETLDPRPQRPVRLLTIRREGKPDLISVAWRTCCLAYKLEATHLCPSCPRYLSDDARRNAILRWQGQHGEKVNGHD